MTAGVWHTAPPSAPTQVLYIDLSILFSEYVTVLLYIRWESKKWKCVSGWGQVFQVRSLCRVRLGPTRTRTHEGYRNARFVFRETPRLRFGPTHARTHERCRNARFVFRETLNDIQWKINLKLDIQWVSAWKMLRATCHGTEPAFFGVPRTPLVKDRHKCTVTNAIPSRAMRYWTELYFILVQREKK
jgi:hypothetical protein